MRITFKSIGHADKLCYQLINYHDDDALWRSWYQNGRPLEMLGSPFAYYQTYGDGMVQHEPLRMVGVEYMEDCCLSLVAAWPDLSEAERREVYFALRNRVRPDTARFVAGIEYSEKKIRFFSVERLDVTSAESRKHDRRYRIVPDWAVRNSLNSMLGLLHLPEQGEMVRSMGRFQVSQELHDLEQIVGYSIAIGKANEVAQITHESYYGAEALLNLLDSYEFAGLATRAVKNYQERIHKTEASAA